jgi:hypothetical protein
MALFFSTMSMEGCVTYNPSTETYTVDSNGCVDHGQSKRENKQKESKKTKKSKPVKGKQK